MLKKNEGNVLFYILIAVTLFSALSMSLVQGGGESAVATNSFRISEDITSQAQGIRAALLECKLTYIQGDYPPTPGSNLVSDVACDVDDDGTGDLLIFSGVTGRITPIPPAPFGEWTYSYDGTDNLEIQISATRSYTDPGVTDALTAIQRNFNTQEIAVVTTGSEASFMLCILDDDTTCGN